LASDYRFASSSGGRARARPDGTKRLKTESRELSTIRKSTDPGLTNAERKGLRESEAREVMSEHDDAAKAFQENRERLREARLAREVVAGPILYPAPGVPDETPIANVRFSTRITNALNGGCEDRRRNPAGVGRDGAAPAQRSNCSGSLSYHPFGAAVRAGSRINFVGCYPDQTSALRGRLTSVVLHFRRVAMEVFPKFHVNGRLN
jgi:hypothetical protein